MDRQRLWNLLGIMFALNVASLSAAYANKEIPISTEQAWVELGMNGKIIARAVTQRAQCPSIVLDNKAFPMTMRTTPTPPAFPILVCEAEIPKTTHTASITGKIVPLPNKKLSRIVIIGDTGCRLRRGSKQQACNDPQRWPFAAIATHAANFKPDIVIHLGDYLYREAPCKANNSLCQGSPYGDNWQTWQADFFTPARPLLEVASWIMVRGNHEDCHRAGLGWQRFLDPFPYNHKCIAFGAPYFVALHDANLFIVDSSSVQDRFVLFYLLKIIRVYLDILDQAPSQPIWLLAHKPVWAVLAKTSKIESNNTKILQKTIGNLLPPFIDLILSGHVHRFEMLNFANGRPPQLIVGNSGAALEKALPTNLLAGESVGDAYVNQGISLSQFGYMTMEHVSKKEWRAQLHNVNGATLLHCLFTEKTFQCAK